MCLLTIFSHEVKLTQPAYPLTQNLSCEADSHLASQRTCYLLWDPENNFLVTRICCRTPSYAAVISPQSPNPCTVCLVGFIPVFPSTPKSLQRSCLHVFQQECFMHFKLLIYKQVVQRGVSWTHVHCWQVAKYESPCMGVLWLVFSSLFACSRRPKLRLVEWI